MTPTTQLIATVISIVASYGAFAAWMLRHMDRRFAEAKADTQRQFDGVQRQFAEVQRQFDEVQRRFAEAKADTQRQFDGVQRQFDGIQGQFDGIQGQFNGVQRQFAEFRADMQQGFEQAREDRFRLERKLDVQGEQLVMLHQAVGRLQGIVERTYEPERFTVRPAPSELRAGGEVREARASYDAGSGGEEAGRGGREGESGGGDLAPAGESTGQGDES